MDREKLLDKLDEDFRCGALMAASSLLMRTVMEGKTSAKTAKGVLRDKESGLTVMVILEGFGDV